MMPTLGADRDNTGGTTWASFWSNTSMASTPRIRRIARFVLSGFLLAIALGWLFLYFDSILQRRRAERLISDLKTFPFATAGFNEVRDLMVRYGGHAIQRLPQTPPLTCTVSHCYFELSLEHRLLRLPVRGRAADVLYNTLAYVGVRPWAVSLNFEVKDGRLERSSTTVGQFKMARFGDTDVLDPLEYNVHTERTDVGFRPREGGVGYVIGRPHVTGPLEEDWEAWLVQTPTAPMQRAFDINLACLTTILHGCRDFAELAPFVWADYQREKAQR